MYVGGASHASRDIKYGGYRLALGSANLLSAKDRGAE